jgi:hypothetical protein
MHSFWAKERPKLVPPIPNRTDTLCVLLERRHDGVGIVLIRLIIGIDLVEFSHLSEPYVLGEFLMLELSKLGEAAIEASQFRIELC